MNGETEYRYEAIHYRVSHSRRKLGKNIYNEKGTTGIGNLSIVRILVENGEQVVPYEVDLKTNLNLLIFKCLNISETA